MSKIDKSVVALGTFDGVHLGHQKIIDVLLQEAKRHDAEPILVTFFPHPTHILTPQRPLKMIGSLDERISLLNKHGVKTVVVKEFTIDFSDRPALEFIKNDLIENLNMCSLIVGYDHSFGKNKEADFETLKLYGNKYDFDVKRVSAFKLKGNTISSSLIRYLLKEGRIEKANEYLDYKFCLFGLVVKGNQLGRKIGFKTANIVLDYPNKIVPKGGVYVIQSDIERKTFYGMMNIGFRPTVGGKNKTIEVHFFAMNEDLYDTKIRVNVLYRLRDEFRFDSIEHLKEQLLNDKEKALDYVKKNC